MFILDYIRIFVVPKNGVQVKIEGEKIRIMSKAKEEHKKILRILGVGDKIFRTYESAREFCRLI
ncbi:hypothetical protein [Thermodesulfovibrio hydrogeniphilus]